MKISSSVFIILLIIAVLTSWVLIIEDFETNYIDTNISTASPINETYKSTFGDASEINESMQPLKDALDDITEEDQGFFEGLLDYGVVIPIAVISFVGVIFEILGSMITSSTLFLNNLGIPTEIVGIAIVSLLAFGIFKLMEFWRRSPA